MAYYKDGARKDDARMGPIAKAISDNDVRQAADSRAPAQFPCDLLESRKGYAPGRANLLRGALFLVILSN